MATDIMLSLAKVAADNLLYDDAAQKAAQIRIQLYLLIIKL